MLSMNNDENGESCCQADLHMKVPWSSAQLTSACATLIQLDVAYIFPMLLVVEDRSTTSLNASLAPTNSPFEGQKCRMLLSLRSQLSFTTSSKLLIIASSATPTIHGQASSKTSVARLPWLIGQRHPPERNSSSCSRVAQSRPRRTL